MTKASLNEFRIMIDQALDLEELETLRLMLLESADLTFAEKAQLSHWIDNRSQQVPDLRSSARGPSS